MRPYPPNLLFMLSTACLLILGAIPRNKAFNSTSYRLLTHLLRDYRKHIKPVLSPSDQLVVNISSSLYQIIQMDQTRNLITISAYFEMEWIDAFMQWEPSEWEDEAIVYIQASKLWLPELKLFYSKLFSGVRARGICMAKEQLPDVLYKVKSTRQAAHYRNRSDISESSSVDTSSARVLNDVDVEVHHDGAVRFFLPLTAQALCPVDVRYFPFDTQTCDLKFGAWSHLNNSLTYSTSRNTVNIEDFYDNQEWMLLNASMSDSFTSYLNLSYSAVVLSLRIQRQSFYYTFNLVLPSALITIVALIGFHFPGGSQDYRTSKFRLGIMTLLSMAVLLLSVVTELPKFSSHAIEGKRGSFSSVPLLGIYYFSLLLLIGLGTITSSMFVILEKSCFTHPTDVPIYLRWVLIPFNNDVSDSSLTRRASHRQKPSKRMQSLTVQLNQLNEAVDSEKTTATENGEAALPLLTAVQSLRVGVPLLAHARMHAAEICNAKEHYEDIKTILENDTHRITRQMKEWMSVIHRLEMLSMATYLFLAFLVVYMFFYHTWWY